jgi:hypothetical protein
MPPSSFMEAHAAESLGARPMLAMWFKREDGQLEMRDELDRCGSPFWERTGP